jgi:hypothetical protein
MDQKNHHSYTTRTRELGLARDCANYLTRAGRTLLTEFPIRASILALFGSYCLLTGALAPVLDMPLAFSGLAFTGAHTP